MKTKILFYSMMLIPVLVNGQTQGKNITSGKIVYEDKAKLEIKLEGEAAQFADALPRERISNMVLCFDENYSLYQPEESKKDDQVMTPDDSHMTVRMVVGGGKDKTFCDFRNKKQTEQKEFMTRMFLIESDLGSADWKITENNRTILGYNCMEAIREEKDKKISAWFAPSIPVASGPSDYIGLPGLVLMVDINEGKQTITATTIDPEFKVSGILVRPKEGKKVSPEEYRKIVDDKLKEMGIDAGEGGGGNHVMIRIKG